jgi:hypothetical protein
MMNQPGGLPKGMVGRESVGVVLINPRMNQHPFAVEQKGLTYSR